ncbi:hypothetical protein RUMGNA_00836 [Mediterraneibacter gnavus ATCC 29149]|uniref:Uncharacterized protein n=1 Tax=Mediterraneibacter gnavus (strain ATCC 29149 / DSM 114966 / JCM 6515 / VPI C7-9) TaxID=411470 RepID=A7AZW3_MEDG7|nr:hypothetical protein RUMGNA_00836 [Mediterraneibacter gnavus ATCC 29149]
MASSFCISIQNLLLFFFQEISPSENSCLLDLKSMNFLKGQAFACF